MLFLDRVNSRAQAIYNKNKSQTTTLKTFY